MRIGAKSLDIEIFTFTIMWPFLERIYKNMKNKRIILLASSLLGVAAVTGIVIGQGNGLAPIVTKASEKSFTFNSATTYDSKTSSDGVDTYTINGASDDEDIVFSVNANTTEFSLPYRLPDTTSQTPSFFLITGFVSGHVESATLTFGFNNITSVTLRYWSHADFTGKIKGRITNLDASETYGYCPSLTDVGGDNNYHTVSWDKESTDTTTGRNFVIDIESKSAQWFAIDSITITWTC